MRTLWVVVASVIASSCAMAPSAQYNTSLLEVRRPADVQTRWGDYTITPADSGSTYVDELVDVAVFPRRGAFALAIENRTEHSLQVVWDEMAYVGPSGFASKVASGETRFIDVGKAQTPTVIPARSKVALIAIPADHIRSTQYGHVIDDFVDLCESAADMEGREFKLILPFRIQDTVNEYTFLFQLKDVVVPTLTAEQRRVRCRR